MGGTRVMTLGALVALGLSTLACGGGAASGDAGGGAGTGGGAGSSGAGGMCVAFAACGGSVVGTWKIDPRCAPAGQIGQPSACAGEVFDASKIVPVSTLTFGADLTATVGLSVSGTVSVQAPESCLVSNGAPVACADAGAYYAGRITFVGGKAMTGTCQSAGGICSCTVPFVAAPLTGSGTYSTTGTALTVVFGTDASTTDYCATASTLKMRQRAAPNAVSEYAKQ